MSIHNSLKKLNEDQFMAATNYQGPYMIIAGPGSGKTATIVHRVAYMIHQGVAPHSIILFTFTNKAAQELKERVVKIVGDKGKKIVVGTYHSVCARLLRRYATILEGYDSQFTIYDVEDSKTILKPVCKDKGIEEKEALSQISSWKNSMITPKKAMSMSDNSYDDRMAEIYEIYQRELSKQNAMDFDDLIWNMIKVMEIEPKVKDRLNREHKYILSDESHDSNVRDLKLIKMLSGENQNVCFVMDPNQSIYGFRGSDLKAVMEIPKDYNNMKTFQLRVNYRCDERIIEASESLISNNEQMEGREIYANNKGGDEIIYMEADNQDEESYKIASIIKTIKESGQNYSDIAILLRMNYLSRPIEKALSMLNIPYEMVSSVGFFERKEIKDLMSYLRLVYNPSDYAAFERVINVPKRGIGKASLAKIVEKAESDGINYIEATEKTNLRGKAKNSSLKFVELIEGLRDKISYYSPGEIIEQLLHSSGYYKYINEYEKDLELLDDRLANIEELIALASEYVDLQELIQSSALFEENNEDEDDSTDRVQIMTIHASKGLEWKNVIIAGLNEKVLPHSKSVEDNTVDEERRLMYVAMTRAKNNLFITRPKMTYRFGSFDFMNTSRFIYEIESYLTKID